MKMSVKAQSARYTVGISFTTIAYQSGLNSSSKKMMLWALQRALTAADSL
jgi:hypothetical protein